MPADCQTARPRRLEVVAHAVAMPVSGRVFFRSQPGGGPVVFADAKPTSRYDPRSSPDDPRPGEIVLVGPQASVQFRTPFQFRVSRALNRHCGAGWAWLEGYQLDGFGDAVERRQILVRLAGLVRAGGV